MAIGRCMSLLRGHWRGHADTRTHGHSSTCICQAAGSSCTQLLAKQHLKQGAKSRDAQSHAETVSPAYGQAGGCSLSVIPPLEALYGVKLQIELPSTSRAWLPSQYSVSPDNYTSPFLSPPSPTQDLMTVIKMKTSSGKTAMSSFSYQTRPVALAGFNLKMGTLQRMASYLAWNMFPSISMSTGTAMRTWLCPGSSSNPSFSQSLQKSFLTADGDCTTCVSLETVYCCLFKCNITVIGTVYGNITFYGWCKVVMKLNESSKDCTWAAWLIAGLIIPLLANTGKELAELTLERAIPVHNIARVLPDNLTHLAKRSNQRIQDELWDSPHPSWVKTWWCIQAWVSSKLKEYRVFIEYRLNQHPARMYMTSPCQQSCRLGLSLNPALKSTAWAKNNYLLQFIWLMQPKL